MIQSDEREHKERQGGPLPSDVEVPTPTQPAKIERPMGDPGQ